MSFTVTEKAQRSADMNGRCFYCDVAIGEVHKDGCVLVQRRVRMRLTIEFEMDEPASWDKDQVERIRNGSSWCMNNVLDHVDAYANRLEKETGKCLCGKAKIEVVNMDGEPFLDEE